MNREKLFHRHLPPELGPMVILAFLESQRNVGYSEEKINYQLYEEDISHLMPMRQSEILIKSIEWASTEEGHAFWKDIYDKLVENEK